MSLLVIMGPPAVGKMTVGREVEKRIAGKLLYNHQTLDLFADFLGYRPVAFKLSDQTRIALFKAFVKAPAQNATQTLIFTVQIDFSSRGDWRFLKKIARIFTRKGQAVYFVELVSSLETRLKRNQGSDRLAAKPAKRDLSASEKLLVTSHEAERQTSEPAEFARHLPRVPYLRLVTDQLSASETAEKICTAFFENHECK